VSVDDWKTILVVENEETVRQFALTVLRHHGYRTLEAFDGETGLASFRRHRGEVDLILTEVGMPHSGSEMVDSILLIEPAVKILFMSSIDGDGDSKRLRPYPVLQKPFTSDTLLLAIRGALGISTD
jgi:CheY-like chemotaxis protein